MRRTHPRCVPHPLSFSTFFISFFLCSPCLALAHGLEPMARLSVREEFEFPEEHVVLTDCTQGDQRHLTSQMAYYKNAPIDNPIDVAVVDTQPGQNALWINSNTSALFTDSNIYFTATIGPPVKDGEYAGYGHNGADGKLIHNFNCWRKYQFDLYTWQDARCSMVYYCNHDEKPANAPEIVVTNSAAPGSLETTLPAAPVSPSTGSTNETVPTGDQSTTSTGLSHGGLIGTIVGSVAVLVIGGLIGLWLLLRRRSQLKKDKKDLDKSEGVHEADNGTGEFGHGYGDKKGPDEPDARQELDAKLHRFEMDTEAHRFEMANNEVAELDGTGVVVFDRKDSGDIELYDIKHDIYQHHHDDIKGGGLRQEYEGINNGGDIIKQHELGDTGDSDATFRDEPKTILNDELKARAIDKAVIRASTGAGSATVSRWTTNKKETEGQKTEGQETGDEAPLRPPPTRSQTTWTTWTTDSDVDLAGFPLVLMNPMSPVSPISPSEPKPPNG